MRERITEPVHALIEEGCRCSQEEDAALAEASRRLALRISVRQRKPAVRRATPPGEAISIMSISPSHSDRTMQSVIISSDAINQGKVLLD